MVTPTGNSIKLHNVWELTTNQYVPGLVNGYSEGDSASFIVEVEISDADQALIDLGDDGIAGTADDGLLTLDFNIFLDLVADSGADGYAFVDLGNFDDTVTPPIPNTAGGNTIVDNSYSYGIAESETADTGNGSVTVLQSNDGTDNVDILSVTYNGADFSGSTNFQTWNVQYQISDTGTYYFLYGGVLAQPGDTVPAEGGGTTTADFGASEAGNFQARIVSQGTGDKTVPFKGNLIEPIAADPELNIVKTADVASIDAAGDEIVYSYEVTNSVENSEATNVTVTDDNATPGDNGDDFSPTFVGGDTDNDGNLDFGETWIYEETVSVTQAQIDSGADIVNIATANSDETDPVTDDATVEVIQNPLLSIDKIVVDTDNDGNLWNDTNGNNLPDEGETIDYSVKVTNDGNVTLTNVIINDPIAGINNVNVGDLAPGEMATETGSYTLTQADIDAGERPNTATADSDQTDPVEDPEDVPLPQNPEIDLVKDVELTIDADFSQDTSAGDELTYTFTIENTGNVTLTDVTLNDPLPGLSAIDFGSFDGTLDPEEIVTGTATYTVTTDDVEAGEIENTATVAAEAPGGDPNDTSDDVTDTDTETVDLPEPALEIDKTSELLTDADGSLDVSAGDTIRYTVAVSNTGTANLTGVTVFDDLADSFLTLSDNAGDGVDFLAAMDSETAIFDYVVQEDDLGTTIFNTATADSVQTDPVEDTEDVPVPLPELTIDKMFTGFVDNDGNGEITQGDLLNYDIKVSSTGDANLTNVEVTDTLTGLDETIPFLAADGMETFETSYIVTEQDAITGEVLNTAVAESDQTDPVEDPEDVPVKLAVEIDIKPGSFPSSFNLKGNGTVPVAIFGTALFDATDITEVCLEEFLPGPSTGVGCTDDINFEDVNGDGFTDAVAKFSKPDLIGVLDTDSTFAKLTGMTDDAMFVGIGDVNVTQV